MNHDTRGQVDGRLQGKVAIVTGAGSGMGQAVALLFARAGAVVAVSDINREGVEATCALATAEKLTIFPAVIDASDEKSVTDWADAVSVQHGGIDILYNNAAFAHFAPFDTLTLEQWHETLRLELDVVFIPAKAVWQHMIRRGSGSIINIGSISGMRGSEIIGAAAHAAGKSGVIGFTRQLALEGAPYWIRANTISPGPIVTNATKPFIEGNPVFKAAFSQWPLLGRPGVPTDVAYAGLFLASDESAYITGVNFPVDGGVTCKLGFKTFEAS